MSHLIGYAVRKAGQLGAAVWSAHSRGNGVTVAVLALALLGAAKPVCAADAPVEPSAAKLSAEQFFRYPELAELRLSPSGDQIAFIANGPDGRRVLAVTRVGSDSPVRIVARYANADIGSFYWVNNDWLVYTLGDLARGDGERTFGSGLFSVRSDGTGERALIATRSEWVVEHRVLRGPLSSAHRLLAIPSRSALEGPPEVIIGESRGDAGRNLIGVTPLRLNVSTGRTRFAASQYPERARNWVFDAAGEARALQTYVKGKTTTYWRAPQSDRWTNVAESGAEGPSVSPAFWAPDGLLYVNVRWGSGGVSALTTLNLETGQVRMPPLISAPGFDVNAASVNDSATGALLGFRLQTDAETTVWIDPAMKAFQERVDARIPGRINQIHCARCGQSDMVALVRSWSDTDPGSWWIYRAGGDQWVSLGKTRRDIDPRHMATLDLHRIKARDGRDLPVWVTTPPGPKPETPRATVVLVHGGPWVRGVYWRWSPMAQFLASRGYLVIEPEFRGSTGYGRQHLRAGFKQWGGAMQDDVADALRWAVGKGWADPSRVCIAGASYGGYAVLMGLAKTPDLYRCGVAWVAVSDPRLLFELLWVSDINTDSIEYTLPVRLGDPVKDAEALAAAAPVEHADRIKAPVLLAYGGADVRVPFAHGTRMRDAMRAAGNPPEWIVYPEEGHGWIKPENRIDFALRVGKFLAQHLQGAAKP